MRLLGLVLLLVGVDGAVGLLFVCAYASGCGAVSWSSLELNRLSMISRRPTFREVECARNSNVALLTHTS